MKQNLMGIQTDPTDLKEKMRKGKLANVNGKLNWFKFLHPVYILQIRISVLKDEKLDIEKDKDIRNICMSLKIFKSYKLLNQVDLV